MRKKLLCLFFLACFFSYSAIVEAAETYLWPVYGYTSLSRGWSSSHDGLDINNCEGATVRATKSGTVVKVYTGCNNYNGMTTGNCQSKGCCSPNNSYWNGICNLGFGNGVIIKHGDNDYSTYAHMKSVYVSVGSTVSRGQAIGTVGSTGNSSGPHLHFSLNSKLLGSGYNNNKDVISYDYGSPSYTNYINHWAWGFKNGEGNNGAKNAFHLGETTWTGQQGTSQTYSKDRAKSVRGFSLRSTMGSSTFSGTWTDYTLPYTFTQPASFTGAEYDYDPIQYTIKYVLDGGTNNPNNPSDYNILYGISLEKPTKEGYRFVGWKDENENWITGINEGANASFATVDDFYNAVNSRAIGDRTITAVFTAKELSIQTGFYYIKSALNENYAIDIENGSTENHANIQLSVYDKNSPSQLFFIEKIDGEDTYKIINVNSNKSFDITEFGEEDGTNLQQSEWADWINTAQRWDFYNAGDGYVYIQSHYHKNCIDVQNGNVLGNNNIQLWTPNQTLAQKFKLCLIAPSLNISSNKINVGETVTITWEKPMGTQYYDSYLTEFPEGYAYQTNKWHHTGWVAEKYEFSDLPAGHYSFFVHAKNDYATSDQSNWVSFDVYEPEYNPTKIAVYNGHKYILYDYEASWSFCKSLCEEWGGHLVTVTSSEEQEFIKHLIDNGSKDAYWIGLTYYYNNVWRWITDETYSYANWCSNEPSMSGEYGDKEMFAEIRKSYSYGWNDVSNTNCSNKGFILEIDSITPRIDIDVTETTVNTTIRISIDYTDIGSQAIFAIYKNNRLVDLQKEQYEGKDMEIVTIPSYDKIKVLLWENLENMRPLCPVSVYEK